MKQKKTSNCYRKKNGVCCGYGGYRRGPNAVLKKIKNGNFKVTSRFLGREKKNFPPQRNNKSEVEKVQIPRTYTGRWLSPYHRDRVLDTIFFVRQFRGVAV